MEKYLGEEKEKEKNVRVKKKGKAIVDALEIGMFFLMLPAVLLIEVGTRKK